jgi:hypothetical protein
MAKNKVKGLAECKRNIDTVVRNTIPKNAERALYVTLTLIENRSLEYVPLDTGALLNSRYKTIEQGGNYTIGRIGFTQAYALPLHSPKPGGKMDGWKPQTPEDRAQRMSAANYPSSGMSGGYNPSATQDWLNIGLNEAWPEIQRAVKEEMAL